MTTEKCPTCGTECNIEWYGLELVENTGDETLASKSYTPLAIPLHREQGEGSKSQLTGMRKDMEMALQREMMYDKALRDLCHLKKWKDEHGKDSHYEQFQPEAWAYAFDVINTFGAHPHYTPVSKYLSVTPSPQPEQAGEKQKALPHWKIVEMWEKLSFDHEGEKIMTIDLFILGVKSLTQKL